MKRPFSRIAWLAALLAAATCARAEEPAREALFGATVPAGAELRIGPPAPSDRGILGQLTATPDGRRLVSAGNDGFVRVFDLSTGVLLRKMGPQEGGFWREMSMSADGRILVTQATYGTDLLIWNLEEARLVRKVPHGKWIADTALSPDGAVLAWGDFDGPPHFLDVKSGEALPGLPGCESGVTSIDFSPDGRWIVVASKDHVVRLFNKKEQTEARAFDIPDLAYVEFAPSGNRFIVWGNPRVEVFDGDRDWARTVVGPANVCRLRWSPDGRSFATDGAAIGGSEPIVVRDARTGAQISVLAGSAFCDPPVLSADGRRLIAGDWAKLRTWDVATGKPDETGAGHAGAAVFVAWSDDGRDLVSAGSEGTLRRWDAATGHPTFLTFTPGGEPEYSGYRRLLSLASGRLAISEDNERVTVLDVETGRKIRQFTAERQDLTSLALSPDGKRVAFARGDGPLEVRDVDTGALLQGFEVPKRDIRDWSGFSIIRQGYVSWAPDGGSLLWRDGDGGQRLCDLSTGISKPFDAGGVESATFSPDGTKLLCRRAWSVRVLDSATWATVSEIDTTHSNVTCACWSTDGKLAAVGDWAGAIRVFEASTGTITRTFQSASAPIRCLAWSPKAERLACAQDDGSLTVWRTDRAQPARPREANLDDDWAALRMPNGPEASAAWNDFSRSTSAGLTRRLEAEWGASKAAARLCELESDDPDVRRRASAALADEGVLAEPALRAASSPAPEAAAAARLLLARLDQPVVTSPGSLRRLRAILALETIADDEARHFLQAEASSSPSNLERRWAAESLHRMSGAGR